MPLTTTSLPRNEIKIGDRFRKDYGEVDKLVKSIQTYGLIHPPCVDREGNLIAGGRRMAAIDILGWQTVPVTFFEALTERQRRILEMEENVQRKSMTWQEECLAIYEIHQLQVAEGIENKDYWTQQRTGEMLGISTSNVNYTLAVARALRDPN